MSEMILISGFGVRMVSRPHAFWGADGHPLPQTLGEADIISVSGIISETASFAEGKHHSKNAPLIVAFFNDASPVGDMMLFAALKMMLLVSLAMMRCLP